MEKITLKSREIKYLEKRVPKNWELKRIEEGLHGAVKNVNIVLSVTKGNGEPYFGNLGIALQKFNRHKKSNE